MTYEEYVKAYEIMVTVYLNGYKPTNIPSEIKAMIEAADKIVDFQETYPVYAEKYEATFGSPWETA